VVDQTDDEPGGCQCPSVVGAGLERGAGIVECCGLVRRVKAAAQIALLVAPRSRGMRRGEARLELDRLAQ